MTKQKALLEEWDESTAKIKSDMLAQRVTILLSLRDAASALAPRLCLPLDRSALRIFLLDLCTAYCLRSPPVETCSCSALVTVGTPLSAS